MKKTDLAYTAGIIDGEGCIHIRRQWDKRYKGCYKYTLTVSVASTDEWLPRWLQFAWGGCVVLNDRSIANPKWKPAYQWQLASGKALVFLTAILPYLRLKKPQAEIGIGFQKRQRVGGRRTPAEQVLKDADRTRLDYLKRQEMPSG